MTRRDLSGRGPRSRDAFLRTAAPRRWAVDAAIAAVVTAVQVGAAYAGSSWHSGQGPVPILAYVLLGVGGASLIARRRYPVGVLVVTLITTLWASGENAHATYLALIVAFFNAVLARKRAAAIASLIIGYAASVWPWLIGQSGRPSAAFALGLAAGLIFLLSAAELIRSRSQRAAALQRSREEEFRRRASEERMRMARDLHDVVAQALAGPDDHEQLSDFPRILAEGKSSLDRKDLAGQMRHVDDRYVPQNVGFDLEVAVHDAAASGDDVAPRHLGMLCDERIGQPGGELPDHLDQM